MEIITLNRIANMPSAEYHSGNQASSSGLRKIANTSLCHYKYEKENPKAATDAMLFGSAYHSYILTDNAFEDEYYVLNPNNRPEPDKNFSSTKNKDWKAAKLFEHSDKTVIDMEIMEKILAMSNVLQSDPCISFSLSNGIAEESFFAKIDGMEVRVRPDYLTKFGIYDLKTTNDASPEGFGKIIANEKYHIQAALYKDVISAFMGVDLPFFFLAQEKAAPFVAQMYLVPDWLIAQGRTEYREALHSLGQAIETDVWTAYQGDENRDGVRDVSFPRWAIKEVLV